MHTTLAPAESDASTAAISPWMWNRGITFRQRSSGDSASVVAMWRADAVRFAEVSGTSFGFDVVPDVWSSSAVS